MIQRCPCLLRWPIDPEQDSYCGFCGRRLRSVEWKVEYPSIFYVGCEEAQFTLTLYNTGVLPVEITGLDWHPSGESAYRFSTPFQLFPDHPFSETIRLPIPAAYRSRAILLLKIKTNISYRSDLVEIVLHNKPRIEIVSQSEHSVVLVDAPETWEYKTIPLRIKIQDADVVLRDADPVCLTARDEKIAPVSVFMGTSYEKVWTNQQEIPLQMEIPRRFFPENSSQNQVDVCLEIEQKNGGTIRSRWFTLRLCGTIRLDLHLDYLTQKRARVLKGDRNRFRLILEKKGSGGLTIQNLAVHLPAAIQESGLSYLLSLDRKAPFYLMGVYTEIGWLELDAVQWSEASLESAPIRLEAAMEDGRKADLYFNVEVIDPAWEYIAPLAVDFGNTNTAVAEGTTENKPAVVNLGPLATISTNEFKAIAPTMVFYEPDETTQARDKFWDAQSVRVSQVGINAKQLLEVNPQNGARIAATFKPHLGMNREFRFAIMPNVRKPIESVAADYLQAVLKMVVLETGKHHRNIVITHPVRFWTAQRDALRGATLQALRDSNRRVIFLDEASAVVIFDTYKRIALEKSDLTSVVENVLVFDFGGGSVDLTLCQVSHLPNQRWILKPLAYDGTNNFGGDHITRLLADYFYQQAEAGMNGRSAKTPQKWKIPFLRWDQIDYTKSPIYIQRAVGNFINTYNWAESFKIGFLSDLDRRTSKGGASPTAPIALYYWDEQSDAFQEQTFIPEISHEKIESLVREALQRPMQLVRRMMEDMQKLPSEFRLDRVILSGQSSRLHLVPMMIGEVIREFDPLFSEEKLIHIQESKEAVALGGVAYGIIERRVNMEISRLSRSYVFLKRPAGFFGASAYLPVIQRLDSLPKTVDIPPESFDEPDGLSLRYGDQLTLLESFCNLADPAVLESAQPDEDFRKIVDILVTPIRWQAEWVEAARVRVVYSQDEQVQVALIPPESLQESVEPYLLWM